MLLAPTGTGDEHLTDMAKRFTALRTAGFDQMTTPALVIVGDCDDSSELSDRGSAYHADAYHHAPAPKSLLTLLGGEHMLGGVTGYDVVETTDEDPERVAVIQRISWAYLHDALLDDAHQLRSHSATGALRPAAR